jgi:hypothetical protein
MERRGNEIKLVGCAAKSFLIQAIVPRFIANPQTTTGQPHQELGVSRFWFRYLGYISAHFAIGVQNVKQHSCLFFCTKDSACIFPLELSSFACSPSNSPMTAWLHRAATRGISVWR